MITKLKFKEDTNEEINNLVKKAEKIYAEHFPPITNFERAVFFSWGCTIGDCTFCYMSTQPANKKPTETKRSVESILAEFILAKNLGWDIGFFSGGIGVFSPKEIEFLLKSIHEILGERIWLNIGAMPKPLLQKYAPYIKGIVSSIETINPELHQIVCPSKPIEPYERMFEHATELGLQKGMTFIVGMGETKEDFILLKDFIKKHQIEKIHLYGLIPQKGTMFEDAPIPTKEEQAWWIAQLRIAFPTLDIQCGIWEDRVDRISYLLKAGANSISKFQAIKLFGTDVAKEIEHQAQIAGRSFKGTLTKLPVIDWESEVETLSLSLELKEKVKEKLKNYLKSMRKNRILLNT